MRKWLKLLADLMLPRVCVVRGRKLNESEKGLCLYCMAELPLTFFWERSRNPMADKFNGLRERDVDGCLIGGRLERYAYAVALFFYDGKGEYRRITQQLKYHANISVGRQFARMLAQRMSESRHFEDVDVIIPVPLHWTRRWKRGYNQAEVIAGAMAEHLGVDLRTDLLRRSRRTRTQTKVDPARKSENVRGAFTLHKARLQGENYRHIVLVDDVFTSGSTLHNCFLTLRSVLPVSVRISVATLAYVGGA
ncbi:MAG: ComF family protein, partial [Bacteroidales bacterium]|nr:ComF family protein [Bacteroidales bacterium]